MTTIIDYGAGNLFSLRSSLESIGENAVITSDRSVIARSHRLILPGVGAFADAADKLRESGMADAVKEECAKGKPLLGICLGMQLLFEKSYEYGEHTGLGLIHGNVKPIAGVIPKEYKIPHIGWNAIHFKNGRNPIFKYNSDGDYMYFVHSFYAADCADAVTAETEYGAPLTAAVACGNIYGCQFHPEKSGAGGIKVLKAFCELGEQI